MSSVADSCTRPVEECVSLSPAAAVCFGATLPYDSTSFTLSTDANSLNVTREKLLLWSALKAVPKCWEVIQPLLCSVYLPKCESNRVHLPPRSLCQITREPCQVVEKEYGWLDFLQCGNDQVYQDVCERPKDSTKFNKSTCQYPLVPTKHEVSYYPGIEGCGLQCNNPFYTDSDHNTAHVFVAVLAVLSTVMTLFALLSFVVDWKNSGKYPARIVFYINLCFFVVGVGWCIQFIPGARELMVCRSDGTMRIHEPSGSEGSTLCIFVFVVIYFFLMAGVVWFAVLAYVWFVMFRVVGTDGNPLYGKVQKFHLLAWSLPFVMTVACLSFSKIDGDPMSGICFVGSQNPLYRVIFLLLPVGVSACVGGFYISRGISSLYAVRNYHHGMLSKKSISKVTTTMLRLGVFSLFSFAFLSIAFAVEFYSFVNVSRWEESYREYIKCYMNRTIVEQLGGKDLNCGLRDGPALFIKELDILALFGTSIVMSAWVWTRASLENWRRTWYRLIGRSDNEMKRIREPSKLIAKAFRNRELLEGKGNRTDMINGVEGLMFSEHTISHQDPVAMNFVLDSVSIDLSPKWYRHVPKFIRRRGAIHVPPMPGQHQNYYEKKRALDHGHWAMRCSPVRYHYKVIEEKMSALPMSPESKMNTISQMVEESCRPYTRDGKASMHTDTGGNLMHKTSAAAGEDSPGTSSYVNNECDMQEFSSSLGKSDAPKPKVTSDDAFVPTMSNRAGGQQHQQQQQQAAAARLFNYQQQQIQNAAAACYYTHQMQNVAMFMAMANTGALQQGFPLPPPPMNGGMMGNNFLPPPPGGFMLPQNYQMFLQQQMNLGYPPPPPQLPSDINIDNLPPDYHLLTSPTCLPREEDEAVAHPNSVLDDTTATGSTDSDVSLERFGVDLQSRQSGASDNGSF